MKIQPITVFEHQSLKIGENGFTQKHFDSLLKWLFKNKTTDDNSHYFSLVDHGIKFKSWVGILQVGNVFIEVLPKISNQKDSKELQNEWRKRLCEMLSFTKSLDIRQTENSKQNTKSQPLWEIFYKYYFELVQDLIKTGLIKSYKREETNRSSLRGKLLFSQQITKNIVHQEKFYTDATIYNRDSIINQVIFKALRMISSYPSLSHDIKSILENYDDIQDIRPDKINWDKVNYYKRERKTEKYQDALIFAELIIKGSNPDLNTGYYNVTGIMFDMNALFEKYVAQKMSKYLPGKIFAQKGGYIWENRLAKPDIIYRKSSSENIIFDTKWKKISAISEISTNDIFQQYMYCKRFKAKKAFLIYPWYTNFDFGEMILEDSITVETIEVFKLSPYKVADENTALGVLFWKWKDFNYEKNNDK